MKPLMITGALAGFILAVVLGLAVQNDWSRILLNASVTSVACGLALRWWGRVWVRSLHQAIREESAASNAPKETKPSTNVRP